MGAHKMFGGQNIAAKAAPIEVLCTAFASMCTPIEAVWTPIEAMGHHIEAM